MRRGGRAAEGSGLLNRRRVYPLPRVQIPPSPPFFCPIDQKGIVDGLARTLFLLPQNSQPYENL